jgi:hypothetical protein
MTRIRFWKRKIQAMGAGALVCLFSASGMDPDPALLRLQDWRAFVYLRRMRVRKTRKSEFSPEREKVGKFTVPVVEWPKTHKLPASNRYLSCG